MGDFSAVSHVTALIVISIGLPLTSLAICALYSLVRDNHVAPVYVINLLVSDLIQICCLIMWVAAPKNLMFISNRLYYVGLMASVGFMVCVAMERYLVIAFPVWYHFRRNIKVSLVVCFMVWAFSISYVILVVSVFNIRVTSILLSIYLLLPFPLLIFFLAGTVKALSSSISVPPEEKRRIVGTLVLVLLNYTLLFLPIIIRSLQMIANIPHVVITDLPFCFTFIQFSPLMDLVLYVFMRKGAVDKLLACLCPCRMTTEQEQEQISTVDSNTLHTVSSM